MNKKNKPKRIFLVCAGLGMGNASRIFALAQSLHEHAKDHSPEIHIFSWGNGYKFLKEMSPLKRYSFTLHRLNAYPWPSSDAKGLRRLWIFSTYARIYVQNTLQIEAAWRKLRPAVVLFDSDYHILPSLLRSSKIFYLGQAADVIQRARTFSYKPRGLNEKISFFLGEFLDAKFQALVADKVFVPSFIKTKIRPLKNSKYISIPLIVRQEFLQNRKNNSQGSGIITLPSGSGISADKIDAFVQNGEARERKKGGSFVTCPENLDSAKAILIQGGLSSISECVARGKPMIILPIEGRSEQKINAITVERLGLGIRPSKIKVEKLDSYAKSALDHINLQHYAVNGAEVLAKHVLRAL